MWVEVPGAFSLLPIYRLVKFRGLYGELMGGGMREQIDPIHRY